MQLSLHLLENITVSLFTDTAIIVRLWDEVERVISIVSRPQFSCWEGVLMERLHICL